MFERFSLRFKLTVAFIFVASLVVVSIFYQSQTVTRSQKLFSNLIETSLTRLNAAEDLKTTIDDIYHDVLLARHTPSTTSQEVNLQALQSKLQTEQEKYQNATEGDDQKTTLINTFEETKKHLDVFRKESTDFLQLPQNTSSRVLQPKQEILTAHYQTANQQIETLIQNERQAIVDKQKKILQDTNQAVTTTFIVATLPVLIALALGLVLSGAIARRMGKLKQGVLRIANGDFSQSMPVKSRDELGTLAGAFNQMADRLKDSYGRIALEKQRDEALIQSMAEGVIAIDEKGNIVLINSIAVDLLHLPPREQLIDKSLYTMHTLYTDKDKAIPEDLHPVRVALEEAKAVNDIFMLHIDEHKILMHVSASPVIVNDKAAGAVVLLRDVTKEKEIDRMKTEFISLASHQLRTPLSAIKWYTEMLLSGDAGELKPDQKDFAQNIYDSSERMIELVNSLLNISRIESGRIIVDPKPTDLSSLVGGIVTDLRAKTEERRQTLIISVHKDLPKINLDPRLIGQVYMNLLTNAIKYTPKGGEISVFISKKDDQVLSQVTDNGYGIPKAQHDKIFQKFFRAENIVKVETDGTGLGLYLIKAIIESSGGKIWFDSDEGKGTTFWFTLPLSGMKAKEGEVTLDG